MSVRHWLNYKGMNNAQSCAALPVLLRENALCWYNALDQPTQNDFTLLTAAFLLRYKSAGVTGWQDAAAVWGARQTDTQTVDDFINKMERLSTKVNMTAEQKQHAMLNGLKPNIRQQVIQHQLDSVDDIRRWATIAESSQSELESTTNICSTLQHIQGQLNRLEMSHGRARSQSPSTRTVHFHDSADHAAAAAFQETTRPYERQWTPPQTTRSYQQWTAPRTTNRPYSPGPRNNATFHSQHSPQMSRGQSNYSTQRVNNIAYGRNTDNGNSSRRCYNCNGPRPHFNRYNCTAKDAQCSNCLRKGHFTAICNSSRRRP